MDRNEKTVRKMLAIEARRWGLKLTEEDASRMVHDILAEHKKCRKARPVYIPSERVPRATLAARVAGKAETYTWTVMRVFEALEDEA